MFSATSSSIARRMVPMLVPQRSESRRSAGMASPGFHSPRVSASVSRRFTSLYSGPANGTPGAVSRRRVGHGDGSRNDGASISGKAPRCRQVI